MKKDNLQKLIKSLKLDSTNSDINSENFPDDGKDGKVELIDFKESLTSEEAIKRLDAQGYRPATLNEMLKWANGWNGEDFVVALGSIWQRRDGYRLVAYLGYWFDERRLSLYWLGYRWFGHCRFAGVKKEDLTTNQKVTEPGKEPADRQAIIGQFPDRKDDHLKVKQVFSAQGGPAEEIENEGQKYTETLETRVSKLEKLFNPELLT
jgi:hypothetical protein